MHIGPLADMCFWFQFQVFCKYHRCSCLKYIIVEVITWNNWCWLDWAWFFCVLYSQLVVSFICPYNWMTIHRVHIIVLRRLDSIDRWFLCVSMNIITCKQPPSLAKSTCSSPFQSVILSHSRWVVTCKSWYKFVFYHGIQVQFNICAQIKVKTRRPNQRLQTLALWYIESEIFEFSRSMYTLR